MTSKLRSDLILLLAAAIWGFAFVAQRLGMEFLGPFTYTAVRFTLGVFVLLPFIYFRNLTAKTQRHEENTSLASWRLLSGEKKTERRKLIVLQILLGIILFFGISFQQYGLLYTTAGNAGFITGFYVVLVPVAGLFLGHKSHINLWIGVILAITGLYFLSVTREFTINPGDIYVSVCALFWTVHVLLVSYIAPRTDPIRTAIIQFSICALLSWFVAIGVEHIVFYAIIDAAWPIVYGGVMSVGIAYTLQIVAQQKAHPAYASIILSLESVFAVFGGWLILDEHFSSRSILGCGLMLTGMIAVQLRGFVSAGNKKGFS
jgi:drug/metabolite transporter (DMT)-like permease